MFLVVIQNLLLNFLEVFGGLIVAACLITLINTFITCVHFFLQHHPIKGGGYFGFEEFLSIISGNPLDTIKFCSIIY